MNKEELFRELAAKISTGEISRAEVIGRLGGGSVANASAAPSASSVSLASSASSVGATFTVTKMLYLLGAAIVLIGVVIFVGQIWYDIGTAGRIAVTLGLGLVLTAAGSMLLKTKPGIIGSVFHAIGGLLVPGGALVTISELHSGYIDPWPLTLTFAAISVFYFLLNRFHKTPVLTFFTIANVTSLIYCFVQAVTDSPFFDFNRGDIYAYLTMAIGAGYIFLGKYFRGGWNSRLVGPLYFFGSVGLLGAAFSRVFDSLGWQLVFFVLVFGGLALSTHLRSRAVLVVSTLFLIAHITYITGEYFANSIGWPVALVGLGFIFIGLGYAAVTINKKYIK